MKKINQLTLFIFIFISFSFLLVSAVDVSDDSNLDDVKGVNIQIPKAPINYSLVPTVNNTEHFGGYTVATLTTYLQGLYDLVYCQLTGCTMAGDIDMDDNNIINVGEITASNITATQYIFGQPLDGSIGSGILNASSLKVHCGSVNVSNEGGLNAKYPDMKVKIWNYGQNIYCDISGNTVAVPDDAHTVYYVDSNCAVQNTDWATYFSKNLNPPNFVRIFDVYTNDGDIGVLKGGSVLGLKQLREDFSKINCQRSGHLSICDGLTITPSDTFPEINMSSGHFNYISTVQTSEQKNSNPDGIHIVTSSGAHADGTQMNITGCDNGGILTTCSSNKYRRYIVYTLGWGTHTQIHQLAPVDSETYNNLVDCMNVVKNPLSYTLPSNEDGIAVPLNFYCGRRDDISWADGWVDIRISGGGFGATPDLSGFMTYDEWSKNANANDMNLTGLNYLQGITLNFSTAYIGDVNVSGVLQDLDGGVFVKNNTAGWNISIDGSYDLTTTGTINSTYANFDNITVDHIAEKTAGQNVVFDNDIKLSASDSNIIGTTILNILAGTTNTEGIRITSGIGNDEIQFKPTNIGDLGTSSSKWRNLWLSGDANVGGIIDLGTNTIDDGIMTGDWNFGTGDIIATNGRFSQLGVGTAVDATALIKGQASGNTIKTGISAGMVNMNPIPASLTGGLTGLSFLAVYVPTDITVGGILPNMRGVNIDIYAETPASETENLVISYVAGMKPSGFVFNRGAGSGATFDVTQLANYWAVDSNVINGARILEQSAFYDEGMTSAILDWGFHGASAYNKFTGSLTLGTNSHDGLSAGDLNISTLQNLHKLVN